MKNSVDLFVTRHAFHLYGKLRSQFEGAFGIANRQVNVFSYPDKSGTKSSALLKHFGGLDRSDPTTHDTGATWVPALLPSALRNILPVTQPTFFSYLLKLSRLIQSGQAESLLHKKTLRAATTDASYNCATARQLGPIISNFYLL